TRSDNETVWEESISAWVDGEGEIRPDDIDTPYGRQVWDTYHLIGDVMRSKELAVQPSDLFYARLSKAIDEEPPIVASRRKVSGARLGLSGFAVAAAVATVVWVTMPYFVGQQPATSVPAATVLASTDD